MAPYGYGYYWIIGIGLKVFGYQLWFGRALSLIAFMICLACVGRIVWLLTQNRQAIVTAILILLSLFPVQAWIALHRPDLPALALSMLGLWLAFEEDEHNNLKTRIFLNVIVLCLVSAFFFKQTIILPICIVIALYFQKRKYKSAVYALFMFIGVVLLIATSLNRTSGGGYFLQHYSLAHEIPYSYTASIQMIARLVREPATALFLIAIITLLFLSLKRFNLSLLQKKSESVKEQALSILASPRVLVFAYFSLSLTLGFVTSTRRGANVNYYIEASLVGSVALALAWDSLRIRVHQRVIFYLWIALVTLASMFQLARIARGEYFRWQSVPYYKEIVATLENNTAPNTVCISAYPELALLAGREYHFGDWMQYNDGRSEELKKIFWQAMASEKYSAVIWPDATLADSFPGYRLIPMKALPPQKFYPIYLFVADHKVAQ
jgi:4-amino-4-deoxy-L-arabinose transferase-like glycosyltransferase